MAQCHWPWILVRKAMKLLIVIMSILFIALLCFPSKAFSPDLRIRNCAFHEHVAYFYLTNPDIFLFITLTCRKFIIYWVGQKVLSSFPVSQEKPKWTFAQPNILFLYVYILKTILYSFGNETKYESLRQGKDVFHVKGGYLQGEKWEWEK